MASAERVRGRRGLGAAPRAVRAGLAVEAPDDLPATTRAPKRKKYQHLHLPGRSRGPPQMTKITPGPPLDPPQAPSENLTYFRSLPGPPRGASGASQGPPQAPPGTPQGRPEPLRALPTTSQGPPREPNRARGPPQRPQGPPLTRRDPQGTPNTPQGLSCSSSSWISSYSPSLSPVLPRHL